MGDTRQFRCCCCCCSTSALPSPSKKINGMKNSVFGLCVSGFFFFVLVLNLSLASKFVNARVLCLFGRGRYYSTHWPCVYTIAYAKMHKIIHYKHSHAHRTQAHTTPIYICSQRTYGSILWKNGFCCCCRIERWIKWKPSLVRVLILYI